MKLHAEVVENDDSRVVVEITTPSGHRVAWLDVAEWVYRNGETALRTQVGFPMGGVASRDTPILKMWEG